MWTCVSQCIDVSQSIIFLLCPLQPPASTNRTPPYPFCIFVYSFVYLAQELISTLSVARMTFLLSCFSANRKGEGYPHDVICALCQIPSKLKTTLACSHSCLRGNRITCTKKRRRKSTCTCTWHMHCTFIQVHLCTAPKR